VEKKKGVTFAALKFSDEQLAFFEELPGFNNEIEFFISPESMIPYLNHAPGIVVILVNADSLLNEGHNEIDKLVELVSIEPILGVNPIVAVTKNIAEVEELVLERGFASEIIDLNASANNINLKIHNLVLLSSKRYKIEMDYLAQREAENRRKLMELEEIDKETGIFNRDAFSRRTEAMIRANPDKKYVLIRWDIDRFKIYNDTFGVSAGDALLRAIGKSYNDRNFQSVTYGHWVSDHFVMCMEEKMFSSVAVHKYISEQISLYRSDFEFIVRMGIYRITDINLSVTLMCDRAFMAMKTIKNSFEQRIAYYDDSMRGYMMEEQELISDMGPAIQNQEFRIFFQPQYNYATGKMSGAEALVRWIHPEKGLISPGKFIPVFEQNGFICRLDEYIWERVCISIREWKDRNLAIVPVSVNISRRDIYNPNLCDFILGLTKKYDIEPATLRLEITESAYMDEPTQLIKVVEQLKAAGFTIEMDDFGSGYSSLNTLKDVPVDILKLDLKFLSSEGTNKRGGSILTSVVRMANWLTLPIIAEGIETVEQAEFLKSIGCYTMQGYLFSRPLPENEFLKLMEAEDLEVIRENEENGDINNAVDFLNLSTQNALLFNSFVGGAAIVEASKNNLEAIRINDKFFETICVPRDVYSKSEHQCLGCYSEKYDKRFRKMLSDAKTYGTETTCVLHCNSFYDDGERYWTRNRARYLASAGDSDIFYVAIENITENMHLLNENEKVNKELRSIMNNVPCGIITLDNDSVSEERTLSFVNKAALDIFGYTEEEFKIVYKNNRQALFPADNFEQINKTLKDSLEQKRTSFQYRAKIERKNGSEGLVFHQGVINYDDAGAHLVLVLIDMNQQMEGNVTKFGQILQKVYDEVFEINYESGETKQISSSSEYKTSTNDVLSLHDKFTKWIKTYVVEEDRKKLATILDYERIMSIQATGEVPYWEYRIVYKEKAILFLGDAENERIDEFITECDKNSDDKLDYTCSLIKLPHHGAYCSSLGRLIVKSGAFYGVVCTASAATVEKGLESAMSKSILYATYNGDIEVATDGNKFIFKQ